MPEKPILDYINSYNLDVRSIEDAVSRHGKDALDKICQASYNIPEQFDQDIIKTIVKSFDIAPYDCSSILQNIAAKFPDRAPELLAIYLEFFGKYPKDALEEFYYLCVNDEEILNRDLLDAMLKNASAERFRVIREYAEHCGVSIANAGHPGPLLSDNWYDDGAVNI